MFDRTNLFSVFIIDSLDQCTFSMVVRDRKIVGKHGDLLDFSQGFLRHRLNLKVSFGGLVELLGRFNAMVEISLSELYHSVPLLSIHIRGI